MVARVRGMREGRSGTVPVEADTRYKVTGVFYGADASADLADAAFRQMDTQVMPHVPGEVTQEIRRPCQHPATSMGICVDCGLSVR